MLNRGGEGQRRDERSLEISKTDSVAHVQWRDHVELGRNSIWIEYGYINLFDNALFKCCCRNCGGDWVLFRRVLLWCRPWRLSRCTRSWTKAKHIWEMIPWSFFSCRGRNWHGSNIRIVELRVTSVIHHNCSTCQWTRWRICFGAADVDGVFQTVRFPGLDWMIEICTVWLEWRKGRLISSWSSFS